MFLNLLTELFCKCSPFITVDSGVKITPGVIF